MIIAEHSKEPFATIHLDFAELRKKGEGRGSTQAFLLAIDERTRMVACKAGKEDARSVISLLNRDMFKDTKTIVADNGPAFRSENLKNWALQRNVKLCFSAPYHPEANGLAERAIRYIKQFISLYPDFKGGWKCALEAAVADHNHSHTEALGCSPYFAYHGKSEWLHADHLLGITDSIVLREQERSERENERYRIAMKKHYDRLHTGKVPEINVGDYVLVRKGLQGSKAPFSGPYMVVKTARKQGILKYICYNGPNNIVEAASMCNVVPYQPRRVDNRGAACVTGRGRGRRGAGQQPEEVEEEEVKGREPDCLST